MNKFIYQEYSYDELQDFLKKNYKQYSMKNQNDVRYGNMIIYKDITKNENESESLIFLNEQTFQDKREFDKKMRQIEKRNDLKHDNLQKINIYCKINENHFCSSIFRIQIIGEYLNDSLYNEIIKNKKNDRFLCEQKVIEIMSQLMNVLQYIHQKKKKHGNINSHQISVDKQENIKLIDNILVNEQRILNEQMNRIYYAPEQLQVQDRMELKKIKYQPVDIYQTGMTFLFLLTNCDPIAHYNFNHRVINQTALALHVNQITNNYSHNIQQIVNSMLISNPTQRPNSKQIYNLIYQLLNNTSNQYSNQQILQNTTQNDIKIQQFHVNQDVSILSYNNLQPKTQNMLQQLVQDKQIQLQNNQIGFNQQSNIIYDQNVNLITNSFPNIPQLRQSIENNQKQQQLIKYNNQNLKYSPKNNFRNSFTHSFQNIQDKDKINENQFIQQQERIQKLLTQQLQSQTTQQFYEYRKQKQSQDYNSQTNFNFRKSSINNKSSKLQLEDLNQRINNQMNKTKEILEWSKQKNKDN